MQCRDVGACHRLGRNPEFQIGKVLMKHCSLLGIMVCSVVLAVFEPIGNAGARVLVSTMPYSEHSTRLSATSLVIVNLSHLYADVDDGKKADHQRYIGSHDDTARPHARHAHPPAQPHQDFASPPCRSHA